MSDNTQVKSNRDRYTERLKEKYPDRDFSDDEGIFGQINDDYDDYDNRLTSYQERESALSNLFSSNPNSAAFLMDWKNGEDPIISLVRRFGNDFKEALDDPDKQEMLAEANKEYAKRIADESDYSEQYQKNLSETYSTIEQLQKNEGFTDDDIDQAMGFLTQMYRDAILGKFTRETILMAAKAIKYDDDVEQAEQIGETRGRNSKIEEKLKTDNKTDGTASLSGKNGGGASREQIPDLGALDRFSDSDSIWKRGGVKRTKR